MPSVLTVSPLQNPSEYDKITIAGITTATDSHGVVEVMGADRGYSWDQKKSAGSQGQTITYRGWALAKPKIKFKFWKQEQIDAFYRDIVPPIYYDATKTAPKPWDVYHPKLLANEIIWLVTEKIGDIEQPGAQLWTVTIETLEYRQATSKNSTTTPKTSNTNQNGGQTKPTAAQLLQEAIAAERALAALPVGGTQNQNRRNQ